MLQHVGLEVRAEAVEPSVVFWEALGFERVEPPAGLTEFTWLERAGTQIHLMPTEEPAVPPRGHVAIVVEDFEAALERLRATGAEVGIRREYWGAPRAKASAPGGHTVELMAAPPRPSSGGLTTA